MAKNSGPLTLRQAMLLHGGMNLLMAAVVIGLLRELANTVMMMGYRAENLMFGMLSLVVSFLILLGLGKIRRVTGELVRSCDAASIPSVPQKKSDVVLPEMEEPLITAPRAGRMTVEAPAAVYARTSSPMAVKKVRPPHVKAHGPAIEWEAWVGQKLLQKVGIIIVLIGMLVLLQQAFENRWIDELGRVFLALLASVALLAAGEFFQKKYPQWSHGFTGGGLALAYLSVWVAHVLYADALRESYSLVVPASVAFALYGAITAVGVLLAVRYKVQTIAWFAIAGGYLTPLLVDAPVPNPHTFSIYLGILAAGLLILSAFRTWKGIALASFVLTQYYLGVAVYPSVSLLNQSQVIIAVAFFAIFAALPLLRHFRIKAMSTSEDLLLIIGNAIAAYLPVQDALGGWQSERVTLLCLLLAAYTIACAVLALRSRSVDVALGDTYLLGSIALIALALYHQLGWEWLALGWAPYAAATAYLAKSLDRRVLWIASNLLLVVAVASLVTQMPIFTETESSWRPFLSNWSLQSYVVFASLIAMIPVSRSMPRALSGSASAETVMHTLIALLAFGVITFEVTGLHYASSIPLALSYLVFAVIAAIVFFATRQAVWFVTATLLQVFVFLFVFVRGDGAGMDMLSLFTLPQQTVLPIFQAWALVSVLSTITLIGLLFIHQRAEEHPFLPRIQTRMLLLGMIVAQVWLHVSVEIQHVAVWFDWSHLTYERSLSLWWLVVGAVIAHVAATPNVRKVAVLLLALPFLKDVLRIMQNDATMFDTVAWTLIALAVAAYGAQMKKREFQYAGVVALLGIGAADMLTHFSRSDAGLLRSVWWAVAGLLLMVFGFALKTKLLRQASLAIFAATVFKLLLVDFSTLETSIRILASIATGLLLIGASYLYQRYGTPDGDR